jgi:hypothetical protein
VNLRDESGTPLVGVAVVFNASPGAEVSPRTAATDLNGDAETVLRLPAGAGIALATAEAARQVVTFQAQSAGSSVSSFPQVTFDGDAYVGSAAAILKYFQDRGELGNAAGVVTPTTITATGTPDAPIFLDFTTEPSASTVAGEPFATQPAVSIFDQYGNPITNSTLEVTLTLQNGTGTISGDVAVNAVNGVATFSGLSINLAGADKAIDEFLDRFPAFLGGKLGHDLRFGQKVGESHVRCGRALRLEGAGAVVMWRGVSNARQRSTSPKTGSSEPRMVTTSATMQPGRSFGRMLMLQNEGERIFSR